MEQQVGLNACGLALSTIRSPLPALIWNWWIIRTRGAWFSAVSKDDADAIREISKLGLKSRIFSFARATVGDIELAKEVGADGVVVEVPVGQPKLEYQFSWTWKDVLDRSVQALRRTRELGLYTVYFHCT